MSLSLTVVLIFIVWCALTPISSGPRNAPIKATIVQIKAFATGLEMFKGDNGFYPSGTNGLMDLVAKPTNATAGWHGPYLAKIPADFWGHPYHYEYPGRHNTNSFDVSSAGPDGVFGTADDIGNWERQTGNK